MKTIKNIFVLIILIDLFQVFNTEDQKNNSTPLSPPVKGTDYPDITCGKSKPKKSKDCTDYGTDSGMLCCWIEKNNEKSCYLLSEKMADKKRIDGSAVFKDEYGNKEIWECGNNSDYLIIKLSFIFVLLLL